MAASPLFDQLVTGTVTAVNDKGFRLDVSDGWLNYSKFAVGLVAPSKGDAISATLDKAGFVRAVVPADGPAATNGAQTPRIDAQRVTAASGADRDRTITRLAVLKAAAELAAARPELKSGDVLKIAESWERWVNREPAEGSHAGPSSARPDPHGGPEPELDEAF